MEKKVLAKSRHSGMFLALQSVDPLDHGWMLLLYAMGESLYSFTNSPQSFSKSHQVSSLATQGHYDYERGAQSMHSPIPKS